MQVPVETSARVVGKDFYLTINIYFTDTSETNREEYSETSGVKLSSDSRKGQAIELPYYTA